MAVTQSIQVRKGTKKFWRVQPDRISFTVTSLDAAYCLNEPRTAVEEKDLAVIYP
jgi:hypothetical protein